EDAYRQHIINFDTTAQLLYAVNHYNNEFAGRFAFIGCDRDVVTYTGSRYEFIGRHRDVSSPLVFDRAVAARGLTPFAPRSQIKLERKIGAGLNSCGVLQVAVK